LHYVRKISFGESNVGSIYGPEGNLATTKNNRPLHDSFQVDPLENVAFRAKFTIAEM
jgi:hypothetical protein